MEKRRDRRAYYRAYYQENKEKKKVYMRAYYARWQLALLEYKRTYQIKNAAIIKFRRYLADERRLREAEAADGCKQEQASPADPRPAGENPVSSGQN